MPPRPSPTGVYERRQPRPPSRPPDAFVHDFEGGGETDGPLPPGRGHTVRAEGEDIYLKQQFICLHGDNPKAVEMARFIRKTLEDNGIEIKNIREVLKG
ncbi:hypothetical protein MASR2M17_23110 [Aminivibrio sp.]